MYRFNMNRIKQILLLIAFALFTATASAQEWWDAKWTVRKTITLNASETAGSASGPVEALPVLIRLSDANFNFEQAGQDGADIRIVAEDGKTLLPFHVERYDALMHEGFVWVKAPALAPGGKAAFWLYYGNPDAVRADDPAGTYGKDVSLVYHFAGSGSPAQDSSGNNNVSSGIATTEEGAIIGSGLRLSGIDVIEIPATASLEWAQGAPFTVSLWLKSAVLQPNAVILSRSDAGHVFRVGLDKGIPYAEYYDGTQSLRTQAGADVAAMGAWNHLAVVSDGGNLVIYLNGKPCATLAVKLGAMTAPLHLGGDGKSAPLPAALSAGGATNFAGNIDELEISALARSADYVKLACASTQGADREAAFISVGSDELPTNWLSALETGYIGTILGSLTVDGWVVIIILLIMSAISWAVMIGKGLYLKNISRGNELFIDAWEKVAADLSVIESSDGERSKKLGIGPKNEEDLHESPLYRVYHVGITEVQSRVEKARDSKSKAVLSARSIEAIRASIDGAVIHETVRLNRQIVLLTIAISGGPFLGLLGTVVGVMIVFASVAAAGDVNVNAIAPGIAAALAATVAGLAVAIPALFGYNYLLSRIKEASTDMHVFVDEFITKLAEFYSDNEVNQ
jgi:biopolymer transport protein ExbB